MSHSGPCFVRAPWTAVVGLWLGVLSCGCGDGNDGDDGPAGPASGGGTAAGEAVLATASEYCDVIAQSSCAVVAPCCGAAVADCEQLLAGACLGTDAEATGEGLSYWSAQGTACAAEYGSQFEGCGYAQPPTEALLATQRICALVWRGTAIAGQPCAGDWDCAVVDGAPLLCLDAGTGGGLCSPGTPAALGDACHATSECPLAAYCDRVSGTCQPLLPNGAACDEPTQCVAQGCSPDGLCAAPDFSLYCSLLQGGR